jgi:valyl-tRNA synthetase
MKILVPMAGLIDKDAELARIEKQAARYAQDIQGLETRISNPNFGKAPANVQDGARTMLEQKRRELAALKQQEERVRSL